MGSELSWFTRLDQGTFSIVNQTFTSGFFDALMPIVSNLLLWLIPLGILWLIFVIRTDRRGRIVALSCFLVIAATDQFSGSVLKPLVHRVRPCNVIPSTHFYDVDADKWIFTDKFGMTTYKTSFGFPSNHAANMAGQAAFWGYFFPQVSPALWLATIVVGYSRVYLGVHYPSDVAGGYLIGILFGLVIAYPLRIWVLPKE